MANYSKQVASLADKYGINTETNAVFDTIIKLFDNKANYQMWAIKAVFERKVTIDNLIAIADWAEKNHTAISKLSKKNLVTYTSENDFNVLLIEIETIDKIALMKKVISYFNTAQKKMLTEYMKINELTSLDGRKESFTNSYNLLYKFNKMPKYRKEKFISLASAYTSISSLLEGIKNCLNKSYSWNKEDFLNFLEFNQKEGCEIVYNKGNIVIVQIPDFDTAKLLCGGGRTEWCLTREAQYFRNYVTSVSSRVQYFLFNFGKPEADDTAHVGFTVDSNQGITYAHSTKNHNMMGEGMEYRGKRLNISTLLGNYGIDMGIFLRLKGNAPFKWDMENFLKFIKENESYAAICYSKDNRVVAKILNEDFERKILNHTYIQVKSIRNSAPNQTSQYLLFDFNLDKNSENCIVSIYYTMDKFNTETLFSMENAYNKSLKGTNFFETIGIKESDYFKKEKISPSLLLHKLIEENKEDEAVKLIEDTEDEIDVNFVFDDNVPIYGAISKNMVKLFSKIFNHKKFNHNVVDGFENTILGSLIYLSRTPEFIRKKSDEESINGMISEVLNSTHYNLNGVDCVLDTPLNISCESEKSLWITQELVKNPRVDVNLKNDFGNNALSIAICAKNSGAVKALLTRKDLVISKEQIEAAKSIGIDIKKELVSVPSYASAV